MRTCRSRGRGTPKSIIGHVGLVLLAGAAVHVSLERSLVGGTVPVPGHFEPSCTRAADYGWPRFANAAELEADAAWSKYFASVYGELGGAAPAIFPLCTYDLAVINATAFAAAGLAGTRPLVTNTSALGEGDLFRSMFYNNGEGYGVYHGAAWTPLPNDTWTEVVHMVYPTEIDGFWVWRARGSGVWANVGRTMVFPTPADPTQTHAAAIAFLSAGCSRKPSSSWPQMESDIFGFCAREKGLDSIQFAPQDGETPMGTFGLPGAIEIVFTRLDGDHNCGSADAGATLLRSGWRAGNVCACANLPIDPLCGLMAFPPAGLPAVLQHPKLCAAQAANKSVACNGYRCLPTVCAVPEVLPVLLPRTPTLPRVPSSTGESDSVVRSRGDGTSVCGDYPPLLSTTMPNVMLVGDSISMPIGPSPGGYGMNVRTLLTKKNVNVWHNGGWGKGGQAANTVKGLLCTKLTTVGQWLNFTGTADVIHFNFGLHDLVAEGPGEGQEHVDLPTYGANLEALYKIFSAKAKHVIWTTTTPCPNMTTSMGRSDAKVIAYNAQALQSLTKAAAAAGKKLLIDDLYSAVEKACGAGYKSCPLQRPSNVHFEPEGCEFLAEHVVGSVMAVLLNGSFATGI